MNRLFEIGKVPCFVDGYGPATEKRKSGEATVLRVNFRVQPFDAKLAASLDSGVGGDCNIRQTIFNLNSGEPKKRFTDHGFKLEIQRQTLELYPSPDTDLCRIALAQARISGCRVAAVKGIKSLTFSFKAIFGPVGRDELELIHSLFRQQTFITFQESEPFLDEFTKEKEGADADTKAQRRLAGVDDQSDATADANRSKGVNRPLHSQQARGSRAH